MSPQHLARHLGDVRLRDARPPLEQIAQGAAVHVLHRDGDEPVLAISQGDGQSEGCKQGVTTGVVSGWI